MAESPVAGSAPATSEPGLLSPPISGSGAASYDLDALLGPDAYPEGEGAPAVSTPAGDTAPPAAAAKDSAEPDTGETDGETAKSEQSACPASPEPAQQQAEQPSSPPLPAAGGMPGKGSYDLSSLEGALPPDAFPPASGGEEVAVATDARPLAARLSDKVRSVRGEGVKERRHNAALSAPLAEAQGSEGRFQRSEAGC